MATLRARLLSSHLTSILPSLSLKAPAFSVSVRPDAGLRQRSFHASAASRASADPEMAEMARFAQKVLFIPPGVEPEEVSGDMVLPGSNIVVGPYAGHAQIKEVGFVKSSGKAKDCPKDGRPEFAILGRSNVGKSSLINALVKKKEVALTSKKPGKTQLINHFLVNKSWYIVDLPGYG